MSDSFDPAAPVPPGPADRLAAIRAAYPAWEIRHVGEGFGWEATRPAMPNVWAISLDELEVRLDAAEHGDSSG
jgi:hypothetical protein